MATTTQNQEDYVRTVSTPVITTNLREIPDTTFYVETPGQAIPRVDVKLQGKDSRFIIADPVGETRTIKQGHPMYNDFRNRYLYDFKDQKKKGNILYKYSLPKSIYNFVQNLVPQKQQRKEGGTLNYLEYCK